MKNIIYSIIICGFCINSLSAQENIDSIKKSHQGKVDRLNEKYEKALKSINKKTLDQYEKLFSKLMKSAKIDKALEVRKKNSGNKSFTVKKR